MTYARRDARGGVAKRARCEMLLRPRIDLRLTRDDVRRRTESPTVADGVDGVDGSGSGSGSDDETREGNGFLQKAGVDDDVRLSAGTSGSPTSGSPTSGSSGTRAAAF